MPEARIGSGTIDPTLSGQGGRVDTWDRPPRIAVLVKQVPRAESLTLLADGRLDRTVDELEMNAYCRRAVSKGVELAKRAGGSCTVYSLGPPSAEDVVREAVAWGADAGVLVSDAAFAGSDTLATARALATAVEADGPFDLVLLGRNSIDADTGQVGPEVAHLLDLPFAGGVRHLLVEGSSLEADCEMDDGRRRMRVTLPAVLSVAERLIEPCKVPRLGREQVRADRIRHVSADDLGSGPWGFDGSPTHVGAVRRLEIVRHRIRLDGPAATQVEQAIGHLARWGVLDASNAVIVGGPSGEPLGMVPERVRPSDDARDDPAGAPIVAVLLEPGRTLVSRELSGAAARLAVAVGGSVVGVGPADPELGDPGSYGIDALALLDGSTAEEDVAAAVAAWCAGRRPWAMLAPGTLWGREVAGRVAAALGLGLIGDAVALDVERGRLVAWKPAFGGQLVAAITSSSVIQAATVRPGVLPVLEPRSERTVEVERHDCPARGRVRTLASVRDDDVEALQSAGVVISVGLGVDPEEYASLDPLVERLGAQLAASRKVTDNGWLPRSRQVGITGHSVAPDLAVTIGVSGAFNHMAGLRSARIVIAINVDPEAPVFDAADLGLVGDWHELVPRLADALGEPSADFSSHGRGALTTSV